ncbi:unnamed protein product [Rotaria sordida]|uniref:Nuclear receptor domain-containing protein n=1 Tax=Rotaria sordida TaxID=392033 RepID=A0A819C3K4_9BILA|nr:unnamed protein product [Rotaria sordida]CAF3808026.1 unnamed protein product [Rotaria sordida]
MVQNKCKICEVPARHTHFGVISCDPCKTFFKRNAKHGQETLKCRYDGHCEININTRHFSTLNLLQRDQSTLSTDQWALISNLSHCYDEYSGLSIGERFMCRQTSLPIKIRFKSAPVVEFIKGLFDETQLLFNNNRDFLSLSMDDRCTLLHTTIKHIGSLSSNFIYHKIDLFSYPAYYDTVGMITNVNSIIATKRVSVRLDFDVIVLKLLLAILCFSTFQYTVYSHTPPVNLTNIQQILYIQNTYTELLWRYLVYKYNFEGAVKCFSDLIRCLFAVHDTIIAVEEIEWFSDKVNSVIQKTEQTLNLYD